MKSNYDYIKEFVNKHHYNGVIHVQSSNNITIDTIQYVIFDKRDIPSGRKISIKDISYDIDSDLPEDVFYRWLEYIDNNDYVSYIHWMTKMDNHYEPMGINKSESERVRKLIYDKLEEMKNKTWF